MNKTAHVLVLCGLPGSGKSTLAVALKETKDYFDRIVHIEYDSVTRDIQRQTSATAEDDDDDDVEQGFNDKSLEAWRQSRKVGLERLDEELINHFQTNNNNNNHLLVIMDDNFHLRSMRRNVYRICQSHASTNQRLYFCIAWLDTPVDQCLERNRQRYNNNNNNNNNNYYDYPRKLQQQQQIPNHVIQSMVLEPPDPTKASWEQGSIQLQQQQQEEFGNDSLLQIVLQHLQKYKSQQMVAVAVVPPEDPEGIERERQRTRESVFHQYDCYMRLWVGAVACLRRSDTGNANQVRKHILQKLRRTQETKEEDAVNNTNNLTRVVMEWFLEELKSSSSSSSWTDEEMVQLKTAMMQSILKR